MKPEPLIDSDIPGETRAAGHPLAEVVSRSRGRPQYLAFCRPGQEFLDHRQFHHGDDLRAVNWRAYLRLEKLFLKMFQVEPRIPVRILLDCSNSMITGDRRSKFDYARKLAAALCYVGLVRLDTICIQPFGQDLGDAFLCGGGRHRFIPAVKFLEQLKPAGRTNYFQIARDFIAKYPQRGLLIIISDFWMMSAVSARCNTWPISATS